MNGQVESPERDESREEGAEIPSRRSFVGGVIAGVGALGVLRAAEVGAAPSGRAAVPAETGGPSVAAAPSSRTGTILDGLRGRSFRECQVERVATDHLGGAAIVLRGPRGRFQIHVLARGEGAVASTRRHSLYLANRGDGRRATEERHGLALMDIAAWLEEHEAEGPPLAELTLAERRSAHPRGNFLLP